MSVQVRASCAASARSRGGPWCGVELDPALAAAAGAAARALAVERTVRFHAADMHALDWSRFDSLYLYNPFESLLFTGRPAAPHGAPGFAEQVARTEQRLSELPAGTRVVTFHGFGGTMPPSFAIRTSETFDGGVLALWIQQPARRSVPG
jgi:hypothetical protein